MVSLNGETGCDALTVSVTLVAADAWRVSALETADTHNTLKVKKERNRATRVDREIDSSLNVLSKMNTPDSFEILQSLTAMSHIEAIWGSYESRRGFFASVELRSGWRWCAGRLAQFATSVQRERKGQPFCRFAADSAA